MVISFMNQGGDDVELGLVVLYGESQMMIFNAMIKIIVILLIRPYNIDYSER